MSPEQERKKAEAKRESEEKTYGVCADGEKHSSEYSSSSDQINNE